MSAPRLVACAASAKRTGAVRACFKISVVFLLTFAAAGCASAPQQVAAADPAVRVPAAGYSPVLRGYTSLRPVEPLPWREQNDRVAPKPNR